MSRRLCTAVVLAACAVLASCAGQPENQAPASPRTGTPRPSGLPKPVIAAPRPAQAPVPEVRLPAEGAHYRVSKTDTAKSIALRFYGDDRYAEDILELNKETIRRAGGLKPGTVILLPPVRVRDSVAR